MSEKPVNTRITPMWEKTILTPLVSRERKCLTVLVSVVTAKSKSD